MLTPQEVMAKAMLMKLDAPNPPHHARPRGNGVTFAVLGDVTNQPPGRGKKRPLQLYRGLDRLTYRSVMRRQTRKAAGRWA